MYTNTVKNLKFIQEAKLRFWLPRKQHPSETFELILQPQPNEALTVRLQPLRKGKTPLSVRWFPCESYYCFLGFLEKKSFHLASISSVFLVFSCLFQFWIQLLLYFFGFLLSATDRRDCKNTVWIYEFSGESRGICHQPKAASLPLKLLQTFAISTASNVTISYQFYAFRDSAMFFFWIGAHLLWVSNETVRLDFQAWHISAAQLEDPRMITSEYHWFHIEIATCNTFGPNLQMLSKSQFVHGSRRFLIYNTFFSVNTQAIIRVQIMLALQNLKAKQESNDRNQLTNADQKAIWKENPWKNSLWVGIAQIFWCL